ncbi:MAG: PIN domain-containing protein [Nanoarchaeota archaeon]|nr:PIN domain-containing protein [Nanoarchaeota archaeon]
MKKEMLEQCPNCALEFNDCDCEWRKLRSNMVDSSIFIEAWDETSISNDCKLILDGAEKKIFLGHVSTVILGEIFKKLLRLKKDEERGEYRYNEIHSSIVRSLMNFRQLYICEDTIKEHSKLNVRGGQRSQDKLNMACAIQNKCNMFIIKDNDFTIDGRSKPTTLVQITDRNNPKLRKLLDEIKGLQPLDG